MKFKNQSYLVVMPKVIQGLIVVISLSIISSCDFNNGGAGSPGSIAIKMTNGSDMDSHMFLASQGEDFGSYNKLAPNESRKVDVTGLIWKDDGSTGESGYIPVEVIINAGRNGVVLATKTVMVSKVGTHTARFNGSSISYSE